jgi:site-specific DNA-cytosine methylase
MTRAAAIFLCDLSGIMAIPWAYAGYECWCIDIGHSVRNPIVKTVGSGEIHFKYGDVRAFCRPTQKPIDFVAAFPPCTHVATSGARDFVHKGALMLKDALETFEACRQIASWSGAPFFVENPKGVLSNIPHIGKPSNRFHPFQFAGWADEPEKEAYTKDTCLWTGNGFVLPQMRAVDPILGSKMHLLSPSKDRQRLRSQTPQGFSRATFAANALRSRLQPSKDGA